MVSLSHSFTFFLSYILSWFSNNVADNVTGQGFENAVTGHLVKQVFHVQISVDIMVQKLFPTICKPCHFVLRL